MPTITAATRSDRLFVHWYWRVYFRIGSAIVPRWFSIRCAGDAKPDPAVFRPGGIITRPPRLDPPLIGGVHHRADLTTGGRGDERQRNNTNTGADVTGLYVVQLCAANG